MLNTRDAAADGAGDEGIRRDDPREVGSGDEVVVVDRGMVAMTAAMMSCGGTPSVPVEAQPVTSEVRTAATALALARVRVVMRRVKGTRRASTRHVAKCLPPSGLAKTVL